MHRLLLVNCIVLSFVDIVLDNFRDSPIWIELLFIFVEILVVCVLNTLIWKSLQLDLRCVNLVMLFVVGIPIRSFGHHLRN